MHGRPRAPKGLPEDPKVTEASRLRLQKFSRVCNEVLRRVAEQRFDDESLKLSAALLEQNPECYTVWNYRRAALERVLQGRDGSAAAQETAVAELALTERALRKNPKSYVSWHHRRWLMEKGLTPLERELQLVGQLQELDARNFHAWAYRRYIVRLAGISARDEEQHAAGLINSNFSNYSAWHARTTLLHAVHGAPPVVSLGQLMANDASDGQGLIPLPALMEEFDLVHQAFFTDPEDQSAWLYHRWLLATAFANTQDSSLSSAAAAEAGKALQDLLAKEAEMCEQLLDVEPDRAKCKWPLLTLARLQELQAQLGLSRGDGGHSEGIAQLYRKLMEVDPLRKGYYADALQGHAHVMAV